MPVRPTSVNRNLLHKARLDFNKQVEKLVGGLLDSKSKLFISIVDNHVIRERLFKWMFDQYRAQVAGA